VLSGLMLIRETPKYLRSDNGSEFTAKKLKKWLQNVGVITTCLKYKTPLFFNHQG
jgi:putative transposase